MLCARSLSGWTDDATVMVESEIEYDTCRDLGVERATCTNLRRVLALTMPVVTAFWRFVKAQKDDSKFLASLVRYPRSLFVLSSRAPIVFFEPFTSSMTVLLRWDGRVALPLLRCHIECRDI